ncbi:MAG: thiamine ABC transporter ATP-binding protein [Rhodobacteraceae bacterium]|nr:thiamine ABC transporter ATP-binding protein [Paracoccaceae bacterium]
MLTLESLSLTQGDFTLTADLSVEAGARVAIVGPSGGGKTTFLSLIGGFLQPDRGCILWQGRDISRLSPGDRPISMLFQDNNLFPHLTAAQNVGLGLKPSLKLSPEEQDRVDDALTRVGLAGLGGRKPAQLSGGQQGRVALARVLLRAKPLVLLDEPFAALGPALKVEMLDLVKELVESSGATLLMITHDPRDAERIAQQTILVNDGAVSAPVDTATLLRDPPDALRDYLG